MLVGQPGPCKDRRDRKKKLGNTSRPKRKEGDGITNIERGKAPEMTREAKRPLISLVGTCRMGQARPECPGGEEGRDRSCFELL